MTEQPNALEAARRIEKSGHLYDVLEDARIVARAYVAAEARIRVLEEALRAAKDFIEYDGKDFKPSPLPQINNALSVP